MRCCGSYSTARTLYNILAHSSILKTTDLIILSTKNKTIWGIAQFWPLPTSQVFTSLLPGGKFFSSDPQAMLFLWDFFDCSQDVGAVRVVGNVSQRLTGPYWTSIFNTEQWKGPRHFVANADVAQTFKTMRNNDVGTGPRAVGATAGWKTLERDHHSPTSTQI